MNATTTIHDEIHTMITDVTEEIGRDSWSAQVEEIPSVAYSGFIPYTDGGWNGCVCFGLHGEEAWNTKLIEPYVDADYVECADEYRRQNNIAENAEIPDSSAWDDFRSSWEMEDDATWFVYVRAILYTADNRRNESGEDEYLFCLAINTDFNYGRDSVSYAKGAQSHWIWERNVPVSAITAGVLAEISGAMLAAWAQA